LTYFREALLVVGNVIPSTAAFVMRSVKLEI